MQGRCRRNVCVAAQSLGPLQDRAAEDVSVLVVGPTGYIGRFVVKELIRRGHKVTVFARENSGVKGKKSKTQTIQVNEIYTLRGHRQRLIGCRQDP